MFLARALPDGFFISIQGLPQGRPFIQWPSIRYFIKQSKERKKVI
jgi:hypothetical protein